MQLEKGTYTCEQCNREVVGLVEQGYLWPLWMEQYNSAKFPPHGPRLFNIALMQCWHCSIINNTSWHR